MAVYKPTYKDPKTGEKKEAAYWWIDFTIGDKRVRESAETTRKTIAVEYEKVRRHELERAMAGLPSDGHKKRSAPSANSSRPTSITIRSITGQSRSSSPPNGSRTSPACLDPC